MPFKKGQSGNPNGRPQGALGKITIAKEQRRAIFDEEVSQVFVAKIHQARAEYLLDQFLGKSPDEVKLSGEVTTSSYSQEVIAEAKRLLKEKLNGKAGK